jgi:hypothetical protein
MASQNNPAVRVSERRPEPAPAPKPAEKPYTIKVHGSIPF